MFTRSAIFEGLIHSGFQDIFFKEIEQRLLPIWRQLPHAGEVRIFRPVRRDEDAPSIFLIQEIDYPSLEAIDEAMASPVREEARAAHETLLHMYNGRHYHLISRKL